MDLRVFTRRAAVRPMTGMPGRVGGSNDGLLSAVVTTFTVMFSLRVTS